ncbi:helix-turn-helix transcriptional regulator [Pseudomonas stutzeri]|uniref:helix-turn-helix domain-containing protein n=1 Tax=Stutzerimonas stutzeri TaxID=316 RepID=UPI001F5187BE|nr:helix-turn-helix transcriptional regulator [Stutzerimonas stutzeri]MCI0918244.1 helix-turn-helix transcriptional regulator [Stutzerimonas stutzeri]
MSSEALLQLALGNLGCSQKELATRLGVSPTQISKWKKGDHISLEMEGKLRDISKIGDLNPDVIVWTGSLENARKWQNLISHLAELAEMSGETGYNTEPLQDPNEHLCWSTLLILKEMGIEIPKTFPEELPIDYDEHDEDLIEALDENPYTNIIYQIYKSLTNVYGFYYAYIYDLMYDDKLELFETPAENIESELIALAASKLDVDERFARNFRGFKYKTISEFEKWLNIVKEAAFRAGIPLKAELLDLIYESSEAIGYEAEAESLGFNKARLHPDIYMNELLVGMRTIHQVLPAIMKKLGIEDEFQLNTSELRLNSSE